MRKINCIFCQIKKNELSKRIIHESEIFYVIYDGFPIAEPHFLIIPKNHFSKYSTLPSNQFETLKELLNRLQTNVSAKTLAFEHGGTGQTIHHAHIHIIPFDKSINTLLEHINVPGQMHILKELGDLSEYKKYFLFLEKGQIILFTPAQTHIEPGIITNTLAKVLEKPYPAEKRTPVSSHTISKYKNI